MPLRVVFRVHFTHLWMSLSSPRSPSSAPLITHHRYFQSGSTDRSPIRRGLIQVAAAKYTAAIMTEMLPTIRNVTPRKGLNEPSHVVVDSTMLFCPSNAKVLYRLVTCTCRHQSSSRREVRVAEVYDVQGALQLQLSLECFILHHSRREGPPRESRVEG